MKYFDLFGSNTYAGSGNQFYFEMESDKISTGRVFYKISVGGEYNYSILFSNIIDSTYSGGLISQKNMICDSWTIYSAKIGKCKKIDLSKDVSELVMSGDGEESDIVVSDFRDIYFNGQKTKEVMPGEFFASDKVKMEYQKGEYLCLEITFSGTKIPYHEETLLPVFIKEDGMWKYSKFMPFAGMIGCDRKVKGKIAYIGDSITQGIGTKKNSYLHWTAVLSEMIGDKYSYWNLGIGCGTANDAASNGAWLYKAKQSDIVFVCYGVNDILREQSEEQIKADLNYIVEALKKEGKKVIIQTIPPFDYEGENVEKWQKINLYIMTVLKEKADFVFDNVRKLGEENRLEKAKYGGHPNEEGCKLWAQALLREIYEQKIL